MILISYMCVCIYIYIYIYTHTHNENLLIQQGLSHDNMLDKRECWNIESVIYQ